MGRNHNGPLKDYWQTPDEVIEMLGRIDVDPCAGIGTDIGEDDNFTEDDDGLAQPWHGRVFVNPPFSNKVEWLKKATEERPNTECIFVLTPDSTDTISWWHTYIAGEADYIWFSEGRVAYIDPDTGEQMGSPAFGTAISIFGEPGEETMQNLKREGQLVKTVK